MRAFGQLMAIFWITLFCCVVVILPMSLLASAEYRAQSAGQVALIAGYFLHSVIQIFYIRNLDWREISRDIKRQQIADKRLQSLAAGEE